MHQAWRCNLASSVLLVATSTVTPFVSAGVPATSALCSRFRLVPLPECSLWGCFFPHLGTQQKCSADVFPLPIFAAAFPHGILETDCFFLRRQTVDAREFCWHTERSSAFCPCFATLPFHLNCITNIKFLLSDFANSLWQGQQATGDKYPWHQLPRSRERLPISLPELCLTHFAEVRCKWLSVKCETSCGSNAQ